MLQCTRKPSASPRLELASISQSTHRTVGPLLAGVLASPTVHLDMDAVNDLEEVLHHRHPLVLPLGCRHHLMTALQTDIKATISRGATINEHV